MVGLHTRPSSSKANGYSTLLSTFLPLLVGGGGGNLKLKTHDKCVVYELTSFRKAEHRAPTCMCVGGGGKSMEK